MNHRRYYRVMARRTDDNHPGAVTLTHYAYATSVQEAADKVLRRHQGTNGVYGPPGLYRIFQVDEYPYGEETEGQRDTADAHRPEDQEHSVETEQTEALYRVHLIVVDERQLQTPKSYRTEERAATFEQAWAAARTSLQRHAEAEGWGTTTVLSYASCERVPGTERPAT